MSSHHATRFYNDIYGTIRELLPLGWRWRRSPLGPFGVMFTLLDMVAWGSRGYRSTLKYLYEEMGSALGWSKAPSASAFFQARQKLTEAACRSTFQSLAGVCRTQRSHPALSYRGFRLVAVDGTKLALSATTALKDHFRCPINDDLAPQALLTLLWDIGGNVPIDWRLGPHRDAEGDHVRAMMDSLKPGDLLIADRGFPSRELLRSLCDRGIDFLIRVPVPSGSRGRRKEIEDFCALGETDSVVPLFDDSGHHIRVVRNPHPDLEQTIYLTSLALSDGHTPLDISELYRNRWNIETAYREAKCWHQLEHLQGSNELQLQQEVAALMIFWLLQGELAGRARHAYAQELAKEELKKQISATRVQQHPIRFNRKLAITCLAGILRAAHRGLDDLKREWASSLDYLWRNRQRIKDGRSFRRHSQRPQTDPMRDFKTKGGVT